MPFVTKHVRLTNSGKLPDVFLISKIQSPPEIADSKLGCLYFVLQIDSPWNHVSSIGTSMLNIISREYYRQEGHIPLENFEHALAKANRLIEQLAHEGEKSCQDNLHALIALVVGDEIHISYTGQAEAYFLRDDKIGLITEPGKQIPEPGQTFGNMISGEISAHDVIFLGSPSIYSAITVEELRLLLKQSQFDAGIQLARRLKQLKIRNANAIILGFESLANLEEHELRTETETIYLDQPIDSAWSVATYYVGLILKPLVKGFRALARHVYEAFNKTWKRGNDATRDHLLPKAKELLSQTNSGRSKLLSRVSPNLGELGQKLSAIKPPVPNLNKFEIMGEGGVQVNHYGNKRFKVKLPIHVIRIPLRIIQELGKQFRKAIKRNPRTWYIIISLVLLSSIGASIQSRKNSSDNNPVTSLATIEEMKNLFMEANQAKAFGNKDQARQLLLEIIAKGEVAKENSKLTSKAAPILVDAKRDLLVLSGASELIPREKLVSLPNESGIGTVYEGVLYFASSDGKLLSMLLTGGEATILAQLPDAQAINQLLFDPATNIIYLQTYTGNLFTYDTVNEKLSQIQPAEGSFTLSTGLGIFGNTLYLLDPAGDQIWKHSIEDGVYAKAIPYLKQTKDVVTDGIGLAIDGSVFVLRRSGQVSKYTRGSSGEFTLSNVPTPFNEVTDPIGFYGVPDGNSYYLAERGTGTIPPRILEFDKSGKFIHQYFLPKSWQHNIRLLIGNPKSHKIWVLVNKDLYEFTLVQ